jgi:hypothetical protein
VAPAQPSKRERHATTILIITAAFWMALCVLVGLAVGVVG